MGNTQSSAVKKAEEDSEGGEIGSSPSSYPTHKAEPLPSSIPEIVHSSQVNQPHVPTPIYQQHSIADNIVPSSIPLPNTPMAPPLRRDFHMEIPESPPNDQQTPIPSHKSSKSKKRRRNDLKSSPSTPASNPILKAKINGSAKTNGDVEATPAVADTPTSEERALLKKQNKKRRKQASPQPSIDLGNDTLLNYPADSSKTHKARQHSSPNPKSANDTPIMSTPTNPSSRKKRKTSDSIGHTAKKQKHRHKKDMEFEPTSFSGLAESLYAGRNQNGGRIDTTENGSVDEDVEEEPQSELNGTDKARDSRSSSYNASSIASDLEDVTRYYDEMEIDSPEDQVTSDNNSHDANPGSDKASEHQSSLPTTNLPNGKNGALLPSKRPNENDSDEENENPNNDSLLSKSIPSAQPVNNEYHAEAYEVVVSDSEDGRKESAQPKRASSSSKKRFVKPSFFDRIAEGSGSNTTNHNTSSSVAGPSKSSTRKQPKISTILKGRTEDSPEPPKSTGRRRAAKPKEPKSPPRDIITGQFSEFELRNITQAVERWRDEHEMTQVEVNELIQGNPREIKSQEFWARVAATCPNRRRQKVINQCRRKFHNFVARGTWTPEQQEELNQMWEMHGNQYAKIGKLINRHPEDVRDRIRNYVVCGENRRVHPWTPDEEEKLQTIVHDALEMIRKGHEMDGTSPSDSDEDMVDWQRVSLLMDRTRSRLQCIQKWKSLSKQQQQADGVSIDGSEPLPIEQIIQNARDEAAAMRGRERYSIVKAIRSFNVNADSRIPWAKVRSKRLGDRWSRPTLMLVWYRLQHAIPDHGILSVPEIIQQLTSRYRETRKLNYPKENYNLKAEYTEMERKIAKILKHHHRAAKSADTVVKTDDEDDENANEDDGAISDDQDPKAIPTSGDNEDNEDVEEDEETSDKEIEEANDQEVGDAEVEEAPAEEDHVPESSLQHNEEDENSDNGTNEVNGASINQVEDISSSEDQAEEEANDGADDESSDSDDSSEPDDANASASRSRNRRHESIDSESSSDASSIPNDEPPKPQVGQKRRGPSSKNTTPKTPVPAKRRRRQVVQKSRKSPDPDDDGELSSDTNASSVKSIPAR
ncbi:hypothetical protein M426DRAFT_20850 [Hypoxylon sp. CI-4A]|nr:hypothetical protein M426DRAFT_20850 [Hypoxylon sp. CI-4A]